MLAAKAKVDAICASSGVTFDEVKEEGARVSLDLVALDRHVTAIGQVWLRLAMGCVATALPACVLISRDGGERTVARLNCKVLLCARLRSNARTSW